MTIIDIKRIQTIVASVKPERSNSETKKIMEPNTVVFTCEENSILNITLGDYAVIYGITYFINNFPVIEKLSSLNYRYTITLESGQSVIKKTRFLGLGADNKLSVIDFPLTGKPFQFMDLLLRNLTRNTELGAPWIIGGVIDGPTRNIMFDNLDCEQALRKIAETYETEFYVEGVTIHLAIKERQTGLVFQYGQGKGLYTIRRDPLPLPVITRLYARGATTNIPPGYRGGELRLLPPNVQNENVVSNIRLLIMVAVGGNWNYYFRWTPPLNNSNVTEVIIYYQLAGETTWTANGGAVGNTRTIILPENGYNFYFSTVIAGGSHYNTPVFYGGGGGLSSPLFPGTTNFYLERNTNLYPVNEAPFITDDIFPNRIGTVISVDASNPFKFTDINIGFNVNAQMIPGLKAKVLFKSGQLSDYSFNIVSIDASGNFEIELNNNEQAITVPSTVLRPAVGDEYVLVDIIMPQSYIDAAELELYSKAAAFLEKNSVPQFNYIIECDPLYFKNNQIELQDGDIVTILDVELQTTTPKRVISANRQIIDQEINRYAPTVEVGEIKPKNRIEEIEGNSRRIRDFNLRIRRTFAGNRFLDQTPDWNLGRDFIRNIRGGG